MKKSLYIASLILGISSLFSCTADDPAVTDNTQEISKAENAVTATFQNKGQITFGQNFDTKLTAVYPRPLKRASRMRKANAVSDFVWYGNTATKLQKGVAEQLTDSVFMQDFPNNRDNLKAPHPGLKNLSFDFLYVSNGEPVEVWILYSHALYIDDIGIYYYDEQGNKYEKDFWSMANPGWLKDGYQTVRGGTLFKPTFYREAKKDTDTYNQTGEGYKFQLPKGWKFGFYIKNDQNGQKYSTSTLHAKDSKGNLQKQVVTYSYKNYDLVGFEDIFYSGADKDYNDIVMLITPGQVVSPTGQVLVRWVDTEGNELLPNELSGEKLAGTEYTGEAKNIPGYKLVDPSHKSETKTINEYDRDNVITFEYEKIDVEYTINYICQDNNQILETVTGTGKYQDVIYPNQKPFVNHGFVLADKDSITLDVDPTKNVINLYYKHAETSYIVKYLDEETGEELIDPTTVNNKKVGDEVKVDPANIVGYDCTNPTTQTHTLQKDPNENIYIFLYKKQPEPEPEPEPINPMEEPESGTTEPGNPEPGTPEPGTSEPGTTEPGTTEPGTTEPGTPEPGTTEPGTTEPGTTEPVTPPAPVNPDIVITLNSLDLDLICESDDFCVKYNFDELEYGYTDHSASNLVNLELKQGEPIAITIPDINAWANDSKTYWQDLNNGRERACFDLRLYNCRDKAGNVIPADKLEQLFNINYIKRPAGYSVQLDFAACEDQYGNAGVHISILIDRLKQ